jgi:2,3-bisphosphoglycerate-independent phosphoglycerate mutase
MFHAGKVGLAFSSQDAHFSLFGYDWHEMPRRSILEAAGAGVHVGPHDVAVLGRLSTAVENDRRLFVVNRLSPVEPEELTELIGAIHRYKSRGIRFEFTQVQKLEGILTMKGSVSPYITDNDPMFDGRFAAEVLPLARAADDRDAVSTAKALKRYLSWAFNRLNEHPVNLARTAKGNAPLNVLLTHHADRLRHVMPFRKRWGLKGLLISSKLVQWGLASVLGMDVCKVKSSGDPGRDLAERIKIAEEKLGDYDFIHVHTMAPDEAGHAKDPVTKKKVIEALDKAIGKSLETLGDDPEVLLAIASDHSTPSGGPLIHSGEPVPLTMVGMGVRRDGIKRFNEIDCSSGSLGLVRGGEFMLLVINYLDRSRLVRVVHAPDGQDGWSTDYDHFRLLS